MGINTNRRKITHIEKETLLTFGSVRAVHVVISQVEARDEGETTYSGEDQPTMGN